jgi:hypothetical protein
MAASGAAAAIVLDVLLLVLVLGGEALLFADGSRSRRGSSPRVPQRGAPVPTRQVARQNGPREAESCLFLLFLLNALKSSYRSLGWPRVHEPLASGASLRLH